MAKTGNTTAAKKANNSNIGFNAPKNQSALIFPNPTTGAFNIQWFSECSRVTLNLNGQLSGGRKN